MPRLTGWQRRLGVFPALWLAVVTANPAALHVCPRHDRSAVVTDPVHRDHVPPGDAPHEDHGCTCPDAGCCTAGPAAPVASLHPAPRVAAASSERPLSPQDTAPARPPAHFLPFSTAPPAVA